MDEKLTPTEREDEQCSRDEKRVHEGNQLDSCRIALPKARCQVDDDGRGLGRSRQKRGNGCEQRAKHGDHDDEDASFEQFLHKDLFPVQ
jgi:hypothetical protein